MYISTSDWKNYIDKLSKLNKSAADAIVAYVQKNGFGDTDSLIRYANAVVQKYGAGSAALSAAMYDATAEAAGYFYDPAEPAPLPEYGDVAKTVHGTLKRSQNVNELAGAVSRLVKKAGADTTLQNVYRDSKKYGKKKNTGAQFAWVPIGDTCSFCLMLASAGWRNQTIGGKNHAEHIHSNCDCNYAVRFDNHSGVQGYDPDEYKEMYDNAEGDTWNEKVNSMRRAQYAKDKDRINAQKRAAYAERNELKSDEKNAKMSARTSEKNRSHRMQNAKYGESAIFADKDYLKSDEYANKFRGVTDGEKIDKIVADISREIVEENSGTFDETLVLLNRKTGEELIRVKGVPGGSKIEYTQEQDRIISEAKKNGIEIFAIHNHPTGYPPTADDCVSARQRGYDIGLTCGHNGTVFIYYPSTVDFTEKECDEIHRIISENSIYEKDINVIIDTWINTLSDLEMRIREKG